MNAMTMIYTVSGVVVLSEALRRLEYSRLSGIKALGRCRVNQALGVVAWLALASVAACAAFAPLLSVERGVICWSGWQLYISEPPTPSEVTLLGGTAGVVLREWLERCMTPIT